MNSLALNARAWVVLILAGLFLVCMGCSKSATAEPCQSGASCEPRDVAGLTMLQPAVGGAAFDYETPTLETVLENGLHAAGASPTHIAVRGTVRAGTLRCDWRGTALTLGQRETVLRFWLGLDESAALPAPSAIATTFDGYLAEVAPQYRDAMRANLMHYANGGVLTDGLVLTCRAEYDVQEYLLGSGPNRLIVAYDHMAKTRSYDLYRRTHDTGRYGSTALLGEGAYAAADGAAVSAAESALHSAVGGRESVVFLAPMGAHANVSIEAWQAVEQWDLQTDENDVVHAVRYGTDEGEPEHKQPLAALKARITAAVSPPPSGSAGRSSTDSAARASSRPGYRTRTMA